MRRAAIPGRKATLRNWMRPPTRRDIYNYMHTYTVYDKIYTYIYRLGLSSLIIGRKATLKNWMRPPTRRDIYNIYLV